MLEYPTRRGWKIKYSPFGIRYLDENGVKPTSAKLEAFIQTWLYFGFLHELFGDFTDIKSFVTKNAHGKPVVTTAPLQNCLEVVFKRWKGDSPDYGPEGLAAVQGVSQLNHFVGQYEILPCQRFSKCGLVRVTRDAQILWLCILPRSLHVEVHIIRVLTQY